MTKQEIRAMGYVYREIWREVPSVLTAGFVQGILEGGTPFVNIYLAGKLVDAILSGQPKGEMIKLALICVLCAFVCNVLHSLVMKVFNQNNEYMYEQQTGPLCRKSMEMDYEYLEDADVHRLRENVTGFNTRFGLEGRMLGVVYHFARIFTGVIMAVILVVPKLFTGVKRAEGFVGSIGCSALFLFVILFLNAMNTRLKNRLYRIVVDEINKNEKTPLDVRKRFYLDMFAKADTQKDMRMCPQEEIFLKDWETVVRKAEAVKRKICRTEAGYTFLCEPLAVVSVWLGYAFSGIYGYFGIISIGEIVVFASSIKRVAQSIVQLGENLGFFKECGSVAVAFREFMELPRIRHEGTIPVEKRRDNNFSVEFDHVSFRYPGTKDYVIRDLNLSFVIGERLAVVGRNGSGKTTFIKLLCRLYDVSEGCIKVNGIDIRKYDFQEYCRLFGAVFQDFSIFDFPVGESLAASEQVDERRAKEALFRAGLAERMARLPEGLGTPVGKSFQQENGVNFSGGEKQKLAIARAIYRDAPFVIMDEPTAALDPEAEMEVYAGFDRMVGNKTAIYISHRLASCKFCEDILVFDKGSVVQHGTHEELVGQEGLYRRLWEAQAKYYGE